MTPLRDLAMAGNDDVIGGHLNLAPPAQLFHYTTAAGLIGIAKDQRIWATHLRYLNDQRELQHAAIYARTQAENLGKNNITITRSDAERKCCEVLADLAGNIDSGVYVTSFSEERDDLAQWRAYGMPTGSFALGFPGEHLRTTAVAQRYRLARCIYDHATQSAVINSLIFKALRSYYTREQSGMGEEENRKAATVEFGRSIALYGPLLKHRSFAGEKEWRLISEPVGVGDSSLRYRQGSRGIVPYREVELRWDRKEPDIKLGIAARIGLIVGPAPDRAEAQLSGQSIVRTYFGNGCWHGGTDSPYRGP